jgi:hypothetical protein
LYAADYHKRVTLFILVNMKRDDYILAITTGFLTIKDDQLDYTLRDFCNRFELNEISKPGSVSIAGQDDNGKTLSFAAWMNFLHEQEIISIQVDQIENQSEHIINGFTSSQNFGINIITANNSFSYALRTISSTQYEITPNHFIQLIDAQCNAEMLWARITDLVLESNRLNNRSLFPREHIQGFLLNNSDVFDTIASQIFQEIQVECAVHGQNLDIPLPLRNLFYQSNFASGESNHDPVFLYPIKEVTAPELETLVAAQPFSSEIWNAVLSEITQFPQPDLTFDSAKTLEHSVKQLDPLSLTSLTHIVCRVICNLCEEKHLIPVIPGNIQKSFGPDEVEAQRARVRSLMNKDQWFLEGNKNPWELYLFESIPGTLLPESEDAKIKTKFRKALTKIARFAASINSPFEEAFLLADFLLSKEMPAGEYDERHWDKIEGVLKKKKFSDVAVENLRQSLSYAEDWTKFSWSAEMINGLLAVSIADVFGGMGSWNDIYIEKEINAYHQVSCQTFEMLRKYFTSLLSQPMVAVVR